MTKILISYSHSDGKQIADKLKTLLQNQHVAIWIDTQSLKPGTIWLKHIDEAIRDNDYFLAIITKDYLNSAGGLEAYIKLSTTISNNNKDFISLFFIPPKDVKSPILQAYQGIDFSENFDEGLKKLLKFLHENEPVDYEDLISEIEGKESVNPFRRVRAEFFHNNYKLLASAFAEPEKEKYDVIQGVNPIIIFGGRGSGKTMILKSLTPEILSLKYNLEKLSEIKEKGINFIGFYFKLKRGSLLLYHHQLILELGFKQTGIKKDYKLYESLFKKARLNQFEDDPILTAGVNAAWLLTLNELNIKILLSIISQLIELREKKYIDISTDQEEKFVEEILEKLVSKKRNIRFFKDLIKWLSEEIKKIKKFILDIALPSGNPEVNWFSTDSEFLDKICVLLEENIPIFKILRIYLLFDEFENLCPYQQSIINEWIKTSNNFVVKVASKFEGMYTDNTLQGQPLQAGQDYFIWILDYDLNDRKTKSQYQSFIKEICHKLLNIEGYKEKDITKYLGIYNNIDLPQNVIDKEISDIRKESGLELDEKKIKIYRNKFQNAVIYRLLQKHEKVEGRVSRKKNYSGFETYTYLSSGIIRFFLNLVAMAFYKAEAEGIRIKEGQKIPHEYQSWAAYQVSRIWLERISKNLEEYGEITYTLITDLGDIFRERLLKHTSEPETLTIRLMDPYNLTNQEKLRRILTHAIRESILHTRLPTSSMKGKKSLSSGPSEYQLNRIYSPILQISHRNRWPRSCQLSVRDLVSLINPRKRIKTKFEICKKQKLVKDSTQQTF